MSAAPRGPYPGPEGRADLQRRLARAAAAATNDRVRSPEEEAAILEARALALARIPARPTEDEGTRVVTFARGQETYAIEATWVLAAAALGAAAALPGVPPPVVGAAAWKGEMLVLIDLSADAGAAGVPAGGYVLVVGEARPAFGLLADSPGDLRHIPTAAVLEVPAGVARRRQALRGVTHEAVLVLDGAELIRIHS